jgi:predicted amidohydrolase
MIMSTKTVIRALIVALSIFFVGACGSDSALEVSKSRYLLSTLKVAAIQYSSGQYAKVSGCSSASGGDTCAIKEMITQATDQDAVLVVAPELGLETTINEKDPGLGDNPGSDGQWSNKSLIKIFSQQAKEKGIYLVIHLPTSSGKDHFSTQVAFDPEGAVVGVHHKFELFSGEKDTYTPGTDVMVFDSPLGKVGLMICADIYGDMALHSKLAEELGSRVLAFSSYWTAKGAANWQASFAKNWGLYVVASNTSAGTGVGGGIFDPQGKALIRVEEKKPSLAVAEIPAP